MDFRWRNYVWRHREGIYDEERVICDLIKYRDKYDSETFIKAIKYYAKKLKIEEKVYEIMELLTNND